MFDIRQINEVFSGIASVLQGLRGVTDDIARGLARELNELDDTIKAMLKYDSSDESCLSIFSELSDLRDKYAAFQNQAAMGMPTIDTVTGMLVATTAAIIYVIAKGNKDKSDNDKLNNWRYGGGYEGMPGAYDGDDIFMAITGKGESAITSGWGADRSFNRSAQQIAAGHTHHQGVDIPMPVGSPLRTPWDGRVSNTKDTIDGSGGRGMTIISKDGKYKVYFAHLDRIIKQQGEEVKAGEVVALSGDNWQGIHHKGGAHAHIQLGYTDRSKGQDGANGWIDPKRFNRIERRRYAFSDPGSYTPGVGQGSGVNWTSQQKQRAMYVVKKLVAAGLTPEQAAGVAGNMMQETHFSDDVIHRRTMDSNGLYSGGIVQWNGSNLTDVETHFGRNIRDISFEEQVDYLTNQLQQRGSAVISRKRAGSVEAANGAALGSSVFEVLRRQSSAAQAANAFERVFEGSADYKTNRNVNRINYANDVMGFIGESYSRPMVGNPSVLAGLEKFKGISIANTEVSGLEAIKPVWQQVAPVPEKPKEQPKPSAYINNNGMPEIRQHVVMPSGVMQGTNHSYNGKPNLIIPNYAG